MTPEELFDEFIRAYLSVLRTDVLMTGRVGELINTSLEEFLKPWCERIRSMTSAAIQAEREAYNRLRDATIIRDGHGGGNIPTHADCRVCEALRARTTTEGEGG